MPADTMLLVRTSIKDDDMGKFCFVIDMPEDGGIEPSGTYYQTAAINADYRVSAFFRPVPASLTLYLHTDITGSVIAESAADANLRKTSAYKPFGESIDN